MYHDPTGPCQEVWTLLPGFFKSTDVALTKKDYYLIAEQMKPEEIAPEVEQKLDDIASSLGIHS